jgi:hypothetical protein
MLPSCAVPTLQALQPHCLFCAGRMCQPFGKSAQSLRLWEYGSIHTSSSTHLAEGSQEQTKNSNEFLVTDLRGAQMGRERL